MKLKKIQTYLKSQNIDYTYSEGKVWSATREILTASICFGKYEIFDSVIDGIIVYEKYAPNKKLENQEKVITYLNTLKI